MMDCNNFVVEGEHIVFRLDDRLYSEDMVSVALSSVGRPHVLRRRGNCLEVSFLLSEAPEKEFGLLFNDALIAAVRLRA
jgi:hypothetical protein